MAGGIGRHAAIDQEQTMATERASIDISEMPDLLRIVEEIRSTGQPRLLRRDGEYVALVTPVERASADQNGLFGPDDALFELVGVANDPTNQDETTDVSENKYRYLADAYTSKFE
jgi:hypothetical protein